MLKSNQIVNDENGFILVATMLILVVLTLIGISATRTSNIELQVAGNEKWSQDSFYQADGATETTISIIEESIIRGGIDANNYYDTYVNNLNFYLKEPRDLYINRIDTGNPDNFDWSLNGQGSAPNTTRIDVYTPRASGTTTRPFSQLKSASITTGVPGSALNMASGYLGLGTGAAKGGTMEIFDIWSNNLGRFNSETMLRLQYRHVN